MPEEMMSQAGQPMQTRTHTSIHTHTFSTPKVQSILLAGGRIKEFNHPKPFPESEHVITVSVESSKALKVETDNNNKISTADSHEQ